MKESASLVIRVFREAFGGPGAAHNKQAALLVFGWAKWRCSALDAGDRVIFFQ